eukprot:m.267190 g.267190  ORF g.267190 m.267190 type:complete len:60 (+) comp54712_c0_seq12:1303-1482(+)
MQVCSSLCLCGRLILRSQIQVHSYMVPVLVPDRKQAYCGPACQLKHWPIHADTCPGAQE